ncbi:MAG TPA: hypothetical protein VH583_21200 [Vicinamibacterales bacterium]|jgi:hypothetical protein
MADRPVQRRMISFATTHLRVTTRKTPEPTLAVDDLHDLLPARRGPSIGDDAVETDLFVDDLEELFSGERTLAVDSTLSDDHLTVDVSDLFGVPLEDAIVVEEVVDLFAESISFEGDDYASFDLEAEFAVVKAGDDEE